MLSRLVLMSLAPLCALLPGQDAGASAGAPSDGAWQELVDAVRTAHVGGRTQPLTRFQATLRVTPQRADEDSVQIDVKASFLVTAGERPVNLLRYEVDEASQKLEKGRDERGYWARVGDRVENLGGRESAEDRAQIRQQVTLARQLLEFLDPSTVLGRLMPAPVPEPTTLRVGRNEVVDCELVVGVIERFPLFAPPDEKVPEPRCRLRIWIDAATHRLRAVHAAPLRDGDTEAGAGEFLLLGYADQQRDGVLIPETLTVFRGVPGLNGRIELTIEVRAIDLDPDGVTEATMRRPG